jgi:hypothetical protein
MSNIKLEDSIISYHYSQVSSEDSQAESLRIVPRNMEQKYGDEGGTVCSAKRLRIGLERSDSQ